MATTPDAADVTTLVRAHHDRIRDLFTRTAHAGPTERSALFGELRRLLAVHETAEELVVHPVVRTLGGDSGALVVARLGEEGEAKRLLAGLEKRGTEDPGFGPDLATLRAAVLEHAAHEERDELPRLRRSLAPDRLERLATAWRAAEAVAPTHPHPHGPNSGLGNAVVGPFAAIADRVRDAVSSLTS